MDENANAVSVFNKLAELYQEKFMNVDLYGDTFDNFCELVKEKNAAVFEIACGPGNISRYLLNKRPDFKITGIDMAPKMIALARKNNPEGEFLVMDARKIKGINKDFDAVVCGFCLPYFTKSETTQFISDVAYVLKPGGIFYLSTIEDDHSKSGYRKGSTGDEVLMHYYEASFLNDLLNTNGIDVLDVKRKDYILNETPVTDVVIISRKKNN